MTETRMIPVLRHVNARFDGFSARSAVVASSATVAHHCFTRCTARLVWSATARYFLFAVLSFEPDLVSVGGGALVLDFLPFFLWDG